MRWDIVRDLNLIEASDVGKKNFKKTVAGNQLEVDVTTASDKSRGNESDGAIKCAGRQAVALPVTRQSALTGGRRKIGRSAWQSGRCGQAACCSGGRVSHQSNPRLTGPMAPNCPTEFHILPCPRPGFSIEAGAHEPTASDRAGRFCSRCEQVNCAPAQAHSVNHDRYARPSRLCEQS